MNGDEKGALAADMMWSVMLKGLSVAVVGLGVELLSVGRSIACLLW